MPEARSILHVDMDAFFAAVEVLDDPALAGKPLVVGGSPEGHGVVAAASYEARKHGIRSAMPMARAEKLCSELVRVSSRHERYAEISRRVFTILEEYTPLVEPLSIDEAVLDVTGSERLRGSALEIAREIKRRTKEELGLTCSVGLAPNKFLAKMASDLEKPDGRVVVEPGNEEKFLAPLPIERLWGVGPKTALELAGLGVATIGDLLRLPLRRLAESLGEERARDLVELARGIDEREVETGGETKSVSREETFAPFLTDAAAIERKLLELAEDVASTLRAEGLAGRTLHLKVRDENFRTLTRAVTLAEATDLTAVVHAEAVRLWRERVELSGKAVRLLGVGVSGFGGEKDTATEQLDLFDERASERAETERTRRVETTVDEIRRRMGEDAIRRASLLGPEEDSDARGKRGREDT